MIYIKNIFPQIFPKSIALFNTFAYMRLIANLNDKCVSTLPLSIHFQPIPCKY